MHTRATIQEAPAMKYYAVVELDIIDQAWIPAYVANVTKLVERHGGRYLARTDKVQKVEGERSAPELLVIVEWPSETAAKAFYESDEYRPYLQSRIKGAKNQFTLAPGEDITGVAKIPD
jgi:uncharacterized protein (DUF1330 family)